MAKSPCMTCGVHDKAHGRNKCAECWMRAQPIETQVAAAQVGKGDVRQLVQHPVGRDCFFHRPSPFPHH